MHLLVFPFKKGEMTCDSETGIANFDSLLRHLPE